MIYFLIIVPDADGLSSQASISSLHLANTVRGAVQGLGLFWVPLMGAPPYARVNWNFVQRLKAETKKHIILSQKFGHKNIAKGGMRKIKMEI